MFALDLYVNGVVQYVPFHVCLLLSTDLRVSSRCCMSQSFIPFCRCVLSHYMPALQLASRVAVFGHLGGSPFWSIMNKAAINILVLVFWST